MTHKDKQINGFQGQGRTSQDNLSLSSREFLQHKTRHLPHRCVQQRPKNRIEKCIHLPHLLALQTAKYQVSNSIIGSSTVKKEIMTVRSSKSEMAAASSSTDAAKKGGSMLQAHKNAIMCKRPNAKRLSKVEKKRMAALIGWEKRRNQEQTGRPAKKMKLANSRTVTTAASMHNSGRRSRAVSKTDTEGSTSSSEEDVDSGDAESEVEETMKKP
eukprot:scaffold13684_cov72-Skeletonema_dohrnii-CCMP3373.AAC.2